MIQSMTGYGKAVVTFKEKKINVEIKSLNSKALDLSARIAPLYREKEMDIRQKVAKSLERGKVDFAIWIEKDDVVDAASINAALVDTDLGCSEPYFVHFYLLFKKVVISLRVSCLAVLRSSLTTIWSKFGAKESSYSAFAMRCSITSCRSVPRSLSLFLSSSIEGGCTKMLMA